MELEGFIKMMEAIAPPELAREYDNVGLLVGTTRKEINKVLVALDCTVEVVLEAVKIGADLVLTHHPMFFGGIKHILPDDPETAAAYMLIRNNIAFYAAHTNLDAAKGGVNDALCDALGILNPQPLMPVGMGRIGDLSKACTLDELARHVEATLGGRVKVAGDGQMMVSRVATVGGTGGSDIMDASKQGAQAFVTGEAKHHEAINAKLLKIGLIVAGHYETERVVLNALIKSLHKCENAVQYSLTRDETASYRSV